MKKTIMALFTHADDIECTCSGTLAKFIKDGYAGFYVIATRSNSGYQHLASTWTPDGKEEIHFMHSEEIARIRRKEAEGAAGELGATPIFLDFKEVIYTRKDGTVICPDIRSMDFGGDEPAGRDVMEVACIREERVREMEDLLVKHEPEICLTWDMFNANPDHYCTFILVYKAFVRAARRADLGTLYASAVQIPVPLSPYFGRKPDWFVDVSDPEILDRCGKALTHHVSQFPKGTDLYNHGWGSSRGKKGEFFGLASEKRIESFVRITSGREVLELDIRLPEEAAP